jgi:hypothetical protein
MMERKVYSGGNKMLEHFSAGDGVLLGEVFVRDEVKFNLIHMITGFESALKLKTPEGYTDFRPILRISSLAVDFV